MGRKSKQVQITTAVRAYLARLEILPPDEAKLEVKHVAKAIGVSRTSLYKYGLAEEIQAAAQRQQARVGLHGTEAKRPRWQELVRQLRERLQQAEERNKRLLAQLNLIEANAARLGIDPEALYRPLVKPVRTIPSNARQRQPERGKSREFVNTA